MSDEVILQYVKSIDENVRALTLSVNTSIIAHQNDDNKRAKDIDDRLKPIEDAYRIGNVVAKYSMRGAVIGVLIGAPAGAVKMGLLDKLISFMGIS